jgi:signal transduction histidine kinase
MTPPEWADRDVRALEEVRATGACTPYEKEYFRRDGTRVPILIVAATFKDNPEEGFCFVIDLTERKKLEQQLLRSQRMESIGTLAGGIAHDLNNVLSPIMMSLAVLEMKFPDDDSKELLDMLSTSAQRGADMVRQVLSFARGVEGRRMEVQIKHLIRDLVKIVNDTFPKNIEVETALPAEIATVLGDPTQLHQVLLNLCVNARDAMPEGGKLVLSIEEIVLDAHYAALNPDAQAGPYLRLDAADTGTGMPPEVIDKIFDPFFTTKAPGKGTGLGLSTTLGIVKSHGGFIRAYSEVGRGTKFSVYLPAAPAGSVAVEAEPSSPRLPRGHGELILVVDDEEFVRHITKQTLETFGYRVALAGDGAEALAVHAMRGGEIAAVLLDMMMPVLDGPATIRVLRRLNPTIRIIGASGFSTHGATAHAASLGVTHFLPKPYTAEALLKMLQEVLPQEP